LFNPTHISRSYSTRKTRVCRKNENPNPCNGNRIEKEQTISIIMQPCLLHPGCEITTHFFPGDYPHPYLRPIPLDSSFYMDHCDTYHFYLFFHPVDPYLHDTLIPHLSHWSLLSSLIIVVCITCLLFFPWTHPSYPDGSHPPRRNNQKLSTNLTPLKAQVNKNIQAIHAKMDLIQEQLSSQIVEVHSNLHQFKNKFQVPSSSDPPLYTKGVDSNQPLHSHSNSLLLIKVGCH
jgi:hypothetical protein